MGVRHPTRTLLEGFRGGKLARHETRLVLSHLMGGCASCRAALAELRREARRPARERTAEREAAYDAAISAAFGVALKRARELARERAEAGARADDLMRLAGSAAGAPVAPAAGYFTWGLCEA